jgi:hypothetical protein
MRDFYDLERYDQWAFVYIPGLPEATGDLRIEMATRQIMFPSDPLSLRVSGLSGGGVMVPSRTINKGNFNLPPSRGAGGTRSTTPPTRPPRR